LSKKISIAQIKEQENTHKNKRALVLTTLTRLGESIDSTQKLCIRNIVVLSVNIRRRCPSATRCSNEILHIAQQSELVQATKVPNLRRINVSNWHISILEMPLQLAKIKIEKKI
jgi:hypothetical protein